ncbi:MAG: glycosyltransferase family 4 protein [Candidatus Competibacteraceae bacterium]|nr:MAG: glycosyltransferase family 4 protein [Candidatus Competibacteraceae bacterium]
MLVLILVMVFGVSVLLTWHLSRPDAGLRILDQPNHRSLHQQPTPRTGGLAILAAGLLGNALRLQFATASTFPIAYLLSGLLPLVLISWLDDRHGIAARWRMAVHLGAAASLLATYVPLINRLEFGELLLALLALLFVTWMVNLYNFMDGMDGFAGGMAVMGFTTLAWLGQADTGFAAFCLIVAAASAGFLVWNFPPARIFLGDTGSTTLGFLAAACSLWGSVTGLFPFWVALLVFSPFSVDATVTLLRRLWKGERIWEAHRSHYYQRLVLLGWGHRRTVLAEYGLMLSCAASALLAVHLPGTGQASLALGWLLIYGGLMWGVGRLERRHATVAAP